MRLSTFGVAITFGALANAEYCRYRIRSYNTNDCSDYPANDAYLSSRDCFDLKEDPFIWIDSIDNTDYCKNGNWIREYKNILHSGSCSNNNRGQQDVSIGKCEQLAHPDSDSIRINYA